MFTLAMQAPSMAQNVLSEIKISPDGNSYQVLLKTEKPKVGVEYLTENFRHMYKASISDSQLKGAILNLNGEDKVTVNVNVTAKSIDSDSKITNKASLTNELLETVQTNTITHTIKKFVNTEMDIDEETGENICNRT